MENNLEIKKLLGQRIKDLRTKKGLTQEQLTEQLNVGQRTLSKIERGNAFVSAETLTKLLTALDIGIDELFNFGYLQEKEVIKKELVDAIQHEKIDLSIMYRIYKSLK